MQPSSDLLTRWPALDVAGKLARLRDTFRASFGSLDSTILGAADAVQHAAAGLWAREPSVWSDDPSVQTKIADRLGWLTSPALMADSIDRLRSFGDATRRAGFTDVVLLGMGGSSLAPEVLRAVIGVAPGYPTLHVLDSTDPAAVRAATTPPEHTLYVVASKSGTTIEPNSLAAYFRKTLEEARVPRWADHFVAITDEGTALAKLARAEGYRDVFINPSDIGGRYSALSFFGLVPAALMGQDVDALVGWGLAMVAACEGSPGSPPDSGARLGLAIGAAARAGRDKLTLLLPPALEPFGLWVEQLVAESTGKQGQGVVPISGEALAETSRYGTDRLFVRVRVARASDADDAEIDRLKKVGSPVVDIVMPELTAIGAEFVRWEIATVIAGALLHINPFDEPNVQQAKDATRTLLGQYQNDGRLPVPAPERQWPDGVSFTLSTSARQALEGADPEALLTLVRPGDYVALLGYVGPDAALFEAFAALRLAVRDRTRAATTWGYGPRYLHSTGQLHKGGPNTGVFVLVTAAPRQDLPIPGEPYSFGTLELAQALGDFASLDRTGRRALHVHLPSPDARLVSRVSEALVARLGSALGSAS